MCTCTPTAELYSLHLLGATGRVRTVMHDGREHFEVPVVALMEGVIHAVNAETPEFVSLDTLTRAVKTWDGKPVTLGHPARNGTACSANSPEVLAEYKLGTITNPRIEGKKMLFTTLVDKARAKRLHPEMYARLEASKQVEVSVGAFVLTDGVAGTHNSKPFKASWREAKGDHLAFLPDGRGACSIEMGCGAHRAASMRVLADHMEIEVLGGAGSGNFGHGGRPGERGGSSGDGGPRGSSSSSDSSSRSGGVPEKHKKAVKDALDLVDPVPYNESDYGPAEIKAWTSAKEKVEKGEALSSSERKIVADALKNAHIEAQDDGEDEEARAYKAALDHLKSSSSSSGGGASDSKPGSLSEKHSHAAGAHEDAASALEAAHEGRTTPGKDVPKGTQELREKVAIKAAIEARKVTQKAVGKSSSGSRPGPYHTHSEMAVMHAKAGNFKEAAKSARKAVDAHQRAQQTLLKFRKAEGFRTAQECPQLESMQTLLDQVGELQKEASDYLDELVDDDESNIPTDVATHEALRTMVISMQSLLSSIVALSYAKTSKLDSASPRYMSELRTALGSRHSKGDLEKIQGIHDYCTALGAACGKGESKLLESAERRLAVGDVIHNVWLGTERKSLRVASVRDHETNPHLYRFGFEGSPRGLSDKGNTYTVSRGEQTFAIRASMTSQLGFVEAAATEPQPKKAAGCGCQN